MSSGPDLLAGLFEKEQALKDKIAQLDKDTEVFVETQMQQWMAATHFHFELAIVLVKHDVRCSDGHPFTLVKAFTDTASFEQVYNVLVHKNCTFKQCGIQGCQCSVLLK